ncbi:TetR/AcrR family transcriptional regulator [Mycobacterium spongiae]|uniref:TetR family transcriptional regulator n=1 Tax=Mycobacterium spongiae TaxID=886343 RepID=A0A975JZD2_9MYCO|nr:TetR/AcrR family transcriptional regulator [Mycobacterium spongiae]QUR68507.1 TetR family transcriptional regulator [Mycobacterium spongiae]
MAGNDWLAGRRTEMAADRILDAAEELYIEHGPASIGMNEIAKAAGCSRATLYRYFENREALRTAYVNRETLRLFAEIQQRISDVDSPSERLIVAVATALKMVRDSPALTAWFAATREPIGGEMAGQSEVIIAVASEFLRAAGPGEEATLQRRARWLIRMITSLLMFPGRDEADERAMLEEFVAPSVLPVRPSNRLVP